MAISQNGYPANNRSLVHNPKVPATRIAFPGGLRRGAVTTVLLYVAVQLHRRVEHGGDGHGMWGYASRNIRGGSKLSNHASGTAIDWRAPEHPLGARNTFSDAQEREICRILDEVDNVVRWGGHYTGRADEMHFEINAPLARVERVAARLLDPGAEPGLPTLRRGDQGPQVREVQQRLALTVDGVFGQRTEDAVKRFQSSKGLAADGVVGPRTWTALGVTGGPSVVVPERKALPRMIDRPFDKFEGSRSGRIICPVGTASTIVSQAWLSVGADGGCRFQAWFQRSADTDGSAPGVGTPVDWKLKNAERRWVEVPSGTEFIQYVITDPQGPGVIALELKPA